MATFAQTLPTTRRSVHALPALRPFFWSHSFSSITRHRVLDSLESAVSDETEATTPLDDAMSPESAHPALLALDAWRGKEFGVAVHALLEAHRGDAPTPQDIDRQMRKSGVRAEGDAAAATAALAAMLERVRESDLGDGLHLAQLRDEDCIVEFGFQLPVAASVSALRGACARHGAADVWPERIATPALNGMLNGFADLIFAHAGRYHVLDYKTNHLGEHLSDYTGASLDAAMAVHDYPLQALLYTVALHRYLRRRLRDYSPERHLGDGVYLFLRGVGLAPGVGVWRRRWPAALIVALDEAFAGAEVAA
jgi:exodeoxyribonuclease V beta subunit